MMNRRITFISGFILLSIIPFLFHFVLSPHDYTEDMPLYLNILDSSNISSDTSTNGLLAIQGMGDQDDVYNMSITYRSQCFKCYKAKMNIPGAFVHVGKSGGSTTSSLMKNGCHTYFIGNPCRQVTNESYVSILTTYWHVTTLEMPNITEKTYDYSLYLVTVRDPMERFISAYSFGHPKNVIAWKWKDELAQKENVTETFEQFTDRLLSRGKFKYWTSVYVCFETLEILAQNVGPNHYDYDMANVSFSPKKASAPRIHKPSCKENSRAMVHGELIQPSNHLYWNMKRIGKVMQWSNQSKSILVLRQSHLWDDWVTANKWLGQKGKVLTYPDDNKRVSSSYNPVVSRELSVEGRKYLCTGLKDEYIEYLQLLLRAKNLYQKDVEQSLEISRKSCPHLFEEGIVQEVKSIIQSHPTYLQAS